MPSVISRNKVRTTRPVHSVLGDQITLDHLTLGGTKVAKGSTLARNSFKDHSGIHVERLKRRIRSDSNEAG